MRFVKTRVWREVRIPHYYCCRRCTRMHRWAIPAVLHWLWLEGWR